MAGIMEMLRIPVGFHLRDMANGDKYTIDEDNTILTPELAESDIATNEAYDERYRQQTKKGNSGKGNSKFKVEKDQLNTEKISIQKEQNIEEKEIDGR